MCDMAGAAHTILLGCFPPTRLLDLVRSPQHGHPPTRSTLRPTAMRHIATSAFRSASDTPCPTHPPTRLLRRCTSRWTGPPTRLATQSHLHTVRLDGLALCAVHRSGGMYMPSLVSLSPPGLRSLSPALTRRSNTCSSTRTRPRLRMPLAPNHLKLPRHRVYVCSQR
jgi:hypothetical protein